MQSARTGLDAFDRHRSLDFVVKVAERRALRADEALAPHVFAVRPYQRDMLVLHVHFEPAHRLTQWTRP